MVVMLQQLLAANRALSASKRRRIIREQEQGTSGRTTSPQQDKGTNGRNTSPGQEKGKNGRPSDAPAGNVAAGTPPRAVRAEARARRARAPSSDVVAAREAPVTPLQLHLDFDNDLEASLEGLLDEDDRIIFEERGLDPSYSENHEGGAAGSQLAVGPTAASGVDSPLGQAIARACRGLASREGQVVVTSEVVVSSRGVLGVGVGDDTSEGRDQRRAEPKNCSRARHSHCSTTTGAGTLPLPCLVSGSNQLRTGPDARTAREAEPRSMITHRDDELHTWQNRLHDDDFDTWQNQRYDYELLAWQKQLCDDELHAWQNQRQDDDADVAAASAQGTDGEEQEACAHEHVSPWAVFLRLDKEEDEIEGEGDGEGEWDRRAEEEIQHLHIEESDSLELSGCKHVLRKSSSSKP